MKSQNFYISISTLVLLLFNTLISFGQNSNNSSNEVTIEVIQFHSEHRCITCKKTESLTIETLKSYPNIPFVLVNVDDEKNEKKAEQFEATGTALFLYNPKTGQIKDLTDFAFMNSSKKPSLLPV